MEVARESCLQLGDGGNQERQPKDSNPANMPLTCVRHVLPLLPNVHAASNHDGDIPFSNECTKDNSLAAML